MTILGIRITLSKTEESPEITSVLVFLTIFVFMLLIMTGCGSKNEAVPDSQIDFGFEPSQIVGIGRVEPELKILDIASTSSGIIVQLPVGSGDQINRGQTILELDNGVERARLEQAAARIDVQTAQIEAAKAALAVVRIRTQNAMSFYERTKSLFEQGAETEYSYDLAKTEYESFLQEIKQLEAGLVSAEKLLLQYRADQLLAKAEYEKRFIKAPSDGQVLSLDIALGSLVTPQKSFGTFAPASPLSAWVEIDELFASKVQSGQRAYIRQQGMAEPLAWGEVSFVGPYLREKSIFSDEVGDLQDRRVREVRILLDPEADILFGSRIECVILLKNR
jgi:multidrug efflux pump subunit AcrA (membrane-fusion protein)